ncbi:MAG: ABC transporter permease [Actinomycetota bacterium]|nr:ABC transporter permease [Actinomycetota bacterium]
MRRGARNVLRNPIRLVIVTILLGTCLMFAAAMVALNAGTQERLEEVRSSIGPTIDIWPAGPGLERGGAGSAQAGGLRDTLSEETLRAVAKVPDVESVYGRIEKLYTGSELKGSVKHTEGPAQSLGDGADDETVPPTVVGVDPNDPQGIRVRLTTARIVTGRELTAADAEANVATMGKALAEANDLDVGSQIDIEGKKVEIIGLYVTGERLANDSLVLPLKTMQGLYSIDGVSSATVHVASGAQASDVADKLRETLGDDVEIRSQEDLLTGIFAGTLTSTLKALEAAQRNTLGGLIAALITAAVVIVFAVFLIVRERTREIGVLKALGASGWHVIGQFGVEVLALSGIAAVVATGLLALAGPVIASTFDLSGSGVLDTGYGPEGVRRSGALMREIGASSVAGATDPLSVGLTVETLLLLLGLSVLLAVIASVIPALYVSRTKPAEVLRQA